MHSWKDSRALTPYRLFAAAAERHPERQAFAHYHEGFTYRELRERVDALAAALIHECGLATGATVALIGVDCAAWPVASLAIQAAGGVEVPGRGFTGAAEAEAFLDAERPQVTFLSGSCQFPTRIEWLVRLDAEGDNDELEALVAHGRNVLAAAPDLIAARQATVEADDCGAIIRTSGTTGPPKRVRLSRRNLTHASYHLPRRLELGCDDVFLSVLPLWHLYGRLVLYTALGCGARLVQVGPDDLERELGRVRPTFLPGFPLLWERVHHSTLDRLHAGGFRGRLVLAALALARVYHRCRDIANGREPAWRSKASWRDVPRRLSAWPALALLHGPWRLSDRWLLQRLRMPFGGRLRAALIGDAPLPIAIDRSLRAMGLTILEGYGSTEQGVATVRSPGHNVPGTVGTPLPGVMLRLADDAGRAVSLPGIGEIVTAGPQIFMGYAGDPPIDSTTFVALEGRRYYRTGDIGRMDIAGNLQIVGRRAHRLHLRDRAAPVSPEPVESTVLASRCIAHAMLDQGPDGSASLLVVPDFDQLIADGRHVGRDSSQHARFFRRILRRRLRRQDPDLRVPVAGYWLANAPLTPGKELTVTLKMRRAHIRTRLLPRLQWHSL